MENFFVVCYVIMMIGVIESGILYSYIVENFANLPLDEDLKTLRENMPENSDLVKLNNMFINAGRKTPSIAFDNIFRILLTGSYFIAIAAILSR